MKRVMVTGATGFIGKKLCQLLINEGYLVHALYRSEAKREEMKSSYIQFFKGDITDIQSIEKAMEGCAYVFHLAAYAQVWAKPKQLFYDLNCQGAENIFVSAKKQGIERVVFTSTAGVIGPSLNGQVDETTRRTTDFFSEYERTKSLAEQLALSYVKQGLDIVIVNPTRVYGPGELSVSNSVTKMIDQYVKGKFRFLPGNGKSIGNYVFIDDVVNGHLQALIHGKAGERYILGGSNASYKEFFNILAEVSQKKIRMFKLPLSMMIVIANVMVFISMVTGMKPMITPGWVRKFNHHWNVSSNKAQNEIEYQPSDLREGFIRTIKWLNKTETIKIT